MGRQNDSLTSANKIAGCTDNLCVCSSDFANSLAVVWVAEDDSAGDKGRVVSAKHGGCIVNELTSLTLGLLVYISVIS